MILTVIGVLAGACLAGLICLAWFLNHRFRNLRNAVLEYGQLMRQQERRYTALANQHTRLLDRVNAMTATRLDVTTDIAPTPQEEEVDEAVTAWSRILREDDTDQV